MVLLQRPRRFLSICEGVFARLERPASNAAASGREGAYIRRGLAILRKPRRILSLHLFLSTPLAFDPSYDPNAGSRIGKCCVGRAMVLLPRTQRLLPLHSALQGLATNARSSPTSSH